jgi:tetratricopeptide (TPR) repeat protein
MKKRLNVISLLFLLLFFSYCGKEDKQQIEPQGSSVHAALAEIDSLMWRQPDSAFALLLQFVGSPEADGLDTYNGHYCQLLISELLYKNDCEQTNRQDLQKAVAYFDSLVWLSPPFKGVPEGRGIKTNLSNQNNSIPFLTARAHYINGVGYYERDSLVEACAEYLKALETMEEHHEEQELVGKKAQFMALTYGRLGDMFSEQFMMEPSITCYENALVYCNIEPTSPTGVSNLLTRLGVQYDKLGDKEKMRDYYKQALETMPSSDNLSYRDLAASKALCDYQLGLGIDHSLAVLRQILVDADDEEERKTRFLTIGAMFAEEGIYDSAMYYLEPLFEKEEDIALKIPAAECLRTIYDSIGDNEKLDKCLHFMALQKKSEAQNKALVSQLEDMFKSYTNQKLKNEAERTRKKSIRKTIKVIVPIAVVIALAILVMAKLRSKKLLRQQQEEADRSIEAERQAHRMEQAAMSGRLKRKNEEVRELKDQIKKMDDLAAKTEVAASFDDEPICRLIMDRVNEGQFKSKIDYIIYKDSALDKQQLLDLRLAVDRHFGQFTIRLKKTYPELTNSDLDYCCLYLLGLTDADIAALMQRTYNTVFERNRKMRKIFGSENPLPITLMGMAKDSLFI